MAHNVLKLELADSMFGTFAAGDQACSRSSNSVYAYEPGFGAQGWWRTVWAIETARDSERGDPRQAPVVIDSSA
jgi:hypothetical protein